MLVCPIHKLWLFYLLLIWLESHQLNLVAPTIKHKVILWKNDLRRYSKKLEIKLVYLWIYKMKYILVVKSLSYLRNINQWKRFKVKGFFTSGMWSRQHVIRKYTSNSKRFFTTPNITIFYLFTTFFIVIHRISYAIRIIEETTLFSRY